jgi:hypothetical protein
MCWRPVLSDPHLQIRRAVGQRGLTEERFVTPALAITFRGFPRGWAGVPAEEDTTVAFTITDATASWTLQRKDGGWVLLPRQLRRGISEQVTGGPVGKGDPTGSVETADPLHCRIEDELVTPPEAFELGLSCRALGRQLIEDRAQLAEILARLG